jgi:hypothetical protein
VSLDRNIAIDYVKALAAMVRGVAPHEKRPDNLSRAIKARELEPRMDDFESLVRETVHRIRGDDE